MLRVEWQDGPDPSPVGRVAVVGAGPRAVGWLERVAANLAAFEVPELELHLIDPFPAGGGRIWRWDQSPLLKLNSLAEDVTMFTDEASTIEGPVASGPALDEWAEAVRTGRITDVVVEDPVVRDELERLGPTDFPTRRLQSVYLDWFTRRAIAGLPASVRVVQHRDTVVAVEELPDGAQRVRLASGEELDANLVVYALGHTGSEPDGRSAALADFADRHGLAYVPPAYTADADLSVLSAGEPVLVQGMGLAATDLLVLLTEGRGGRFEPVAGERLRYLPSGREPHVLIGSRRGVPYHSKITATIQGQRPEPRFFTPAIAAELAARPTLDLRDDVWPLIAKEMLHGYYAELFSGHPDRVTMAWDTFLAAFAPLDPYGDDLRALVERTVLDPRDRLDLAAFDRPLAGVDGRSADELQEAVRAYVAEDLRLRTQQEGSASLGLFLSLLQSLFALVGVVESAPWSVRSRERDLEGWWLPTFSFIASGPPGRRLQELLALSEAGVVTFLGSGLEIAADEEAGVFRARGANLDVDVPARALVDAWLPPSRAASSESAALRDLIASATGIEQQLTDEGHTFNSGRLVVAPGDARVVGQDAVGHPRRYAIGPFTTAPFVGAFARPRTDAVSFRENDAVARAVLADLARIASPVELRR